MDDKSFEILKAKCDVDFDKTGGASYKFELDLKLLSDKGALYWDIPKYNEKSPTARIKNNNQLSLQVQPVEEKAIYRIDLECLRSGSLETFTLEFEYYGKVKIKKLIGIPYLLESYLVVVRNQHEGETEESSISVKYSGKEMFPKKHTLINLTSNEQEKIFEGKDIDPWSPQILSFVHTEGVLKSYRTNIVLWLFSSVGAGIIGNLIGDAMK